MYKIGPNWSFIPHGTGSRKVTVQYLRLDQIGPMSHMGPGPISDIGPGPMLHIGLAYYWQVRFLGGGWLGGWLEIAILMKTQSSDLDLDFNLGFVKSIVK